MKRYYNIKNSMKHILFFLLFFSIGWASCVSKKDILSIKKFHGKSMGTTYSITVIENPEIITPEKYEEINKGIADTLRKINKEFSVFDKNSLISKFNKFNSRKKFKVSLEFALLIKTALKTSEKTKGAFDITVGPLISLWGFGNTSKTRMIPPKEKIELLKNNSGYKNLIVEINKNNSNYFIRKLNPKIECNLSAIAKGYGVDQISRLLDSLGFKNYMVEIGGEVKVSGNNHLNSKWKIGIMRPKQSNDEIQKVISLKNQAIATSGDYNNYFEIDGVRYSHTINPNTGYPIRHKLASVTVIHKDCIMADTYATAINVLGPENGFNFAIKNRLSALFIIKTDTGFIEKITPEFQKILSEN